MPIKQLGLIQWRGPRVSGSGELLTHYARKVLGRAHQMMSQRVTGMARAFLDLPDGQTRILATVMMNPGKGLPPLQIIEVFTQQVSGEVTAFALFSVEWYPTDYDFTASYTEALSDLRSYYYLQSATWKENNNSSAIGVYGAYATTNWTNTSQSIIISWEW